MNSSVRRGDDLESMVKEENDNNFNGDSQQMNQKCYRRHTLHQIQRLEVSFRDCPHLDKKQIKELSEELGMEPSQVKFWFQNKRTQMKEKHEHQENTFLRAENEKLREENSKLREALRNACCHSCGNVVAIGGVCLDECHLRKENTRLREDFARVSAITVKHMGRQLTKYIPNLSSSSSSAVGRSTGFGRGGYFHRNNDKQGK